MRLFHSLLFSLSDCWWSRWVNEKCAASHHHHLAVTPVDSAHRIWVCAQPKKIDLNLSSWLGALGWAWNLHQFVRPKPKQLTNSWEILTFLHVFLLYIFSIITSQTNMFSQSKRRGKAISSRKKTFSWELSTTVNVRKKNTSREWIWVGREK